MNILYDIFQRYPAIPVAASIIAGILIGEHWQHSVLWIIMAITLAIAAIILNKYGKLMSATMLVGFCCIGAFLSSRQQKEMNFALPKNEIAYEAVIISEAKEHPKTWSADIAIISGTMKSKTIKAYFSKKTETIPIPTTRFKAVSTLASPSNIGNKKFNYSLYLRRHGICATTFILPWKYQQTGYGTEGLPRITSVTARLRLIRLLVLQKIGKWNLHKDAEILVAGIALGQKNAISRDLRETYSQAGAAHILALSGLHLTIIWSLFGIVFIGRWRMMSTMLSLATIWAYTMLVGLPPSAVRAAIMLTVCSVASLTGRKGASLNSLAFAAIVIFIINPAAIHDLGVQLSFSAVAFILLFMQPFTDIIPQEWQASHRIISKLWQICVLTIVANIGTLPLVAYNFARVPLYVVFTNIIAIPLVTLLLWLFAACTLLMIIGIPETIFKVAVWLLNNIATCLNTSMELIASLPCSSIEGIDISATQTIILYIGITSLMFAAKIALKPQ